ncbi:MAG: hypothetical protein AAF489_10995 [Bacteroidota bacterium]
MESRADNPYVGLRPFQADESLLFFGRREQTIDLLQSLHKHHFVAVVGGSGSGKSSLIRAGLVPSLKAGYLVDDNDKWCIANMNPGRNPLYNLAESLTQQINPDADSKDIVALVEKIEEEGADAILELIRPLWDTENTNFFLLIDQFEELFRFSMHQTSEANRDEAIDFVNIFLELSEQTQIPFYVVLTMRSDFIGDCADFHGLPEAMNRSQYLIPRMNREQLKMVIEGPSRLYGTKVDPTLTSRLLNHLSRVKDELPLLQHALMRMWDYEINENKSGELDLVDYNAIGGISNALSKHAEEALSQMKESEVQITEDIFKALTAIDENGRKIRRPILLSELEELTGVNKGQLLSIIDCFIKDKRSFLFKSKIADSDDILIDISHESLIRQWDTLNHWVDEEGESASYYLQLIEARRLHSENKKDFLSGSELQIAIDWRDRFKPSQAWANRYKDGFEESMAYLNASEKERTRILDLEKDRRRKKRIMMGSIMGLLVVIAVGSVLLGLSINKSKKELEKSQSELIKETNKKLELYDQKQAAIDTMELAIKEARKAKDEAIPWIIRATWRSGSEYNPDRGYVTGLRGLIAHGDGIINLDKIRYLAPVKIFNSGPHESEFNWYSDKFAHYNPEFVQWVSDYLIPGAEDESFRLATQPIYDKHLAVLARAYCRSYEALQLDPTFVEEQKAAYLDHIKLTRAGNFFNGGAFSEYFVAMDKLESGVFPYYAHVAAGFWIRREIDGTADDFIIALRKLIKTYDPDLEIECNTIKHTFSNAMAEAFVGDWRIGDFHDSRVFANFQEDGKLLIRSDNVASNHTWKFLRPGFILVDRDTVNYGSNAHNIRNLPGFEPTERLYRLYPWRPKVPDDPTGLEVDSFNATKVQTSIGVFERFSNGNWQGPGTDGSIREYADMGRNGSGIHLYDKDNDADIWLYVFKSEVRLYQGSASYVKIGSISNVF